MAGLPCSARSSLSIQQRPAAQSGSCIAHPCSMFRVPWHCAEAEEVIHEHLVKHDEAQEKGALTSLCLARHVSKSACPIHRVEISRQVLEILVPFCDLDKQLI